MEGGKRQDIAESSAALKYPLKKLILICKTVVVIAGKKLGVEVCLVKDLQNQETQADW